MAECADLRLALKDYRTIGKYTASYRYGNYEQRLVRLDGPNGSVMITSRKARAYFNKKVHNIELLLQTLSNQFSCEMTLKREN